MRVSRPFLSTRSLMDPDGPHEMVVLVVDRDAVAREAFCRELCEVPGAIALDCGDPKFALQAARNMLPTVILHRGAGAEALDLVCRCQGDAETHEIPIVVQALPGELSASDAAATFAAGASDYLASTLERSEVIARLRYHSACYARRREAGEAYATLREREMSLLQKISELERLSSR